jgi:hypothetical protein
MQDLTPILLSTSEGGPGYQEGAIKVYVYHSTPVRIGQFVYGISVLDAGIRHGDIQATPGFYNGGDTFIDNGLVGHVHGQAIRVFNGLNGLWCAFQREIRYRYTGTFAGIVFRDGPANATTRPGNQGYPVF